MKHRVVSGFERPGQAPIRLRCARRSLFSNVPVVTIPATGRSERQRRSTDMMAW
jgi:hypothetical protein